MRKGILFIILALGLNLSILAQETTGIKKDPVERPNYHGTFVLDFGISSVNSSAIVAQTNIANDSIVSNFENKLFGSPVIGIFYKYHLNIGKTGFSLDPGIGFAFNNLKYSNANQVLVEGPETISVSNWSDDNFYPEADLLNKSKMSFKYIEAPVELRYHFNKTNHESSLWLGVGYKIGYLVGKTKAKVKYEVDTKTKRGSSTEAISIQPLKQELTFRIGGGPFSAFYNNRLNGLFDAGKSPLATNPTVHTFGISLANF